MNKTRTGLLLAAALCAFPLVASAQGKKAKAGAATEESAATKADAPSGEAAPKDGAAAAPAEAGTEGGDAAATDATDDLPDDAGGATSSAICEIDPQACRKIDLATEAKKDIKEPIYAVQQIYVLRARRFELNPYWSVSLNDQFVGHPGPGLAANYYITNSLAVGFNGNLYRWFNSDSAFNFDVRRSARVAVPLTEYDWGAAANVTYVPAYGKLAGFGDFIFHWDAYLVGGVGVINTRPIPVIDPETRNFDWSMKLAVNAGLGLRVYVSRWLAATLEVRDYIYQEKLENLEINATDPSNKDTWLQDKGVITNNVQAQLGVSVFLPFSFDYRLPK